MSDSLFKLSSLIAFFMCISVFYILTFWSAFDIDIFPYLRVEQIILLGLFPILKSKLPVLISMTFTLAILSRFLPPGGGNIPKHKRSNPDRISRVIIIIGLTLVTPLGLVGLYHYNITNFYEFFPIFILVYSVFISNFLIEQKIISNDIFSFSIVIGFILLTTTSYCAAKLDSSKIIDNKKFSYSIINDTHYKFIGVTDDYFFFKTLDNKSSKLVSRKELNNIDLFYYDENADGISDSILFKKILLLK